MTQPGDVRVSDAGAVAVHGDVALTGAVVAGRDLFIRQVTLIGDGSAPFGQVAAAPGAATDVCPYPGLDAFTAEQARFFHGRDADAGAVHALLRPGSLAAVVGSSGTGKSSLLAAKVVPALQRGGDGGTAWHVLALRPGRTPARMLADRLAVVLPGHDAAGLARGIVADPASLAALSEQAARAVGRPVAWVVDQLEELFDPAVDAEERRAVLAALRPADGVGVLVALRSDFYGALDADPALARLVAGAQHRLTSLDDDALREVVTLPAAGVGLQVEPALVEQVVRDARQRAGALPFVAVALRQTWQRRRGGWLTVAAYLDSGGVDGALERAAESAWQRLSPAEQGTARRMLLRMSHVSDAGAATRRRCPVTECVTDVDDEARVLAVLRVLVAARLVSVGTAPADPADTAEPTVEPAHDALLTAWPLLRTWLAEDREDQRVRQDVAAAVTAWSAGRQDPAFLFTGARLTSLERLAGGKQAAGGGRGVGLNAGERAFLVASRRLDRRRRTRGRLLVILPLVLAVSVAVATLSVVQQRATQRAKTLSDALQAAAESRSVPSQARDLGALLATAATLTAGTPVTDGALVDALSDRNGPVALARPGSTLDALSPGLDGTGHVVAGTADGRLVSIAPGTGAVDTVRRAGAAVTAVDAAGDVVAAVDVRGSLSVWSGPGPEPLARVDTGPVRAVAVDPARRVVTTAQADGTVRRWRYRADSGGAGIDLVGRDAVDATALEPDGRGGLIATTMDGAVAYLPPPGGRPGTARIVAPEGTLQPRPVHGLTLAGNRLVAVDGALLLAWTLPADLTRHGLGEPDEVPLAGGSAVVAAPARGTVVPDGTVVTGTDSGVLTRWSVAHGLQRQDDLGRYGGSGIRRLATDGGRLAVVAQDGPLQLWDLGGRRSPAGRDLPAPAQPVVVAFGPDGALAVGSAGGEVSIHPRSGPPVTTRVDGRVTALTWRAAGRLVVGTSAGTVVEGGSTLAQRAGVSVVALAAGNTAAGLRLVVGWADGLVLVLDGTARRELRLAASLTALALSRDARLLAVATGPQIVLRDLTSTAAPRVLTGHTLFVASLAFSPDGTRLASGGDDRTTRIWSTATGRELARTRLHADTVRSVVFSPDGHRLASTGDDGTIALWDLVALQRVGSPIRVGEGAVLSMAASPDGDRLVTAGSGVVGDWPFSMRAWRSRACGFAGRTLTTAERGRYLLGRSGDVCLRRDDADQ